ncbi:hypothetical protein NTE_02108 [Candidatus Nitrososphaera evergladensis SR1]|uniref:Uncharacterized protein n=1 Tax=Candidatus Nitrososphaera evergladensis SR1 TaxID=1459636 RepID=A0A075MSN2_9ARCH|nr:hypothetical protein [Candidatus Nitrososphaera evergladensis]AIF84163.1 hypothetical protein NTE_02108 [Candidatus Nitrososphaera evergladensis SR1]
MSDKFELVNVKINDKPAQVVRRRPGLVDLEDDVLDLAKISLAINTKGASLDKNGEIVVALRFRPE